MSDFAYTTLTDAAFVEIASVLLKSLLSTDPAHSIRVMCFPDVDAALRRRLEALDARVETFPIQPVHLPANVRIRHQAWVKAFSRLHMVRFTEFEKLVYLDADMLVRKNIDELFERPSLSAAAHHDPPRDDQMQLNGGTVVLSPMGGLFERVIENLVYLPSPWPPHCWSLSDQEVLTALYSTESYAAEWRTRHRIHTGQVWHHLGYEYNAIVGLQKQQSPQWSLEDAKVLHFTCGPKPWETGPRDAAARIWWRYRDLSIEELRADRSQPSGREAWTTPRIRRG